MTLREFHNNLRIMLNIDRHELDAAKVKMGDHEWSLFQRDPFRWLIMAGDADADRLWSIIENRQPGR